MAYTCSQCLLYSYYLILQIIMIIITIINVY